MIVVGIALSRAIMWSYLVSSLVLWLTGPVAGIASATEAWLDIGTAAHLDGTYPRQPEVTEVTPRRP